MPRSAGLALYLASRSLAPRKKTFQSQGLATPDRLPGDLVWVHAGPGTDTDALTEVARRIADRRPGTSAVITATDPPLQPLSPPLYLSPEPDENPREIKKFLDHWRPDTAVFAGDVATPAAMVEVQSRGIPLHLVDARLPDLFARRLRWAPGAGASLFGGVARILTPTEADAETFRRLKAPPDRVEARGHLEEGTAPLPCNRADHAALAQLLSTRPVWLANSVETAEVEAVVAAHRRAMRVAHRLVLVLVPASSRGWPGSAGRA
jgi:3-deoxy-D-manno-octulosonic-acid transferase